MLFRSRSDYANADRIKKLALYPSAKTEAGKLVSLEEYVKGMAPGQTDIYYLCAPKAETARTSPQLEQALKHKCDVLLFCDPVDEWLVDSLGEFDGKKFTDVARGDVQFGTETEREAEKTANEAAAKDLKPLLEAIQKQLADDISEVRLSTRLADSPCCLVATANGLSPAMERMLRAMNKDAQEMEKWETYRRARLERQAPKFLAELAKVEDDFVRDELLLYYQSLGESE